MKAIGYVRSLPPSDPNSLFDFELPQPVPGARDLLVAVHAVSVNPVDTKVRMRAQGTAEQPKILGFDCAGIVTSVGPEVTAFKPGDEVFYAGTSLVPAPTVSSISSMSASPDTSPTRFPLPRLPPCRLPPSRPGSCSSTASACPSESRRRPARCLSSEPPAGSVPSSSNLPAASRDSPSSPPPRVPNPPNGSSRTAPTTPSIIP